MENIDRVRTSINRIAPSFSQVGKNDPTALSTKEGFAYRETGTPQINDIIECGFVRSNPLRKSNQVWWTYGGKNSFHVNKNKAVLVARTDVVGDCSTGAISIDDLFEIWFYDESTGQWHDRLNEIKTMYMEKQQEFREQAKHR